ncbi:DUF3784 domain-containing protein [Lacinutrix sp. C3R15]|uniref:DUF3784 domain-containing protein n=1 Tax=Flavobacteriaceae TaxID=49546 RepID=UPI001C0A1D80|nr:MULTISPECIES: DUF3784 domain-containing protein [Flavobacteriaceae]MBU2937953.1 DUF3784 domain-containing protein [Lacinutrix sp. C3R15]MDO6621267.1 DUF3784 domain-containing protein [Oceanihabitans sp. 1_MG-2023]
MLITAFIFMLLGALIKYGKCYFLIAGYNTMSKEEKEKYNIAALATLFKNVMFGMALLIIIGYFASKWFHNANLENIFLFISILTGIPYLLITSNSKKYKK